MSTSSSTRRHRESRSGKESVSQGYANDNEDDNAELESIEEQVESDSLSNRSEEDEESRDSSAPPSTSSSQSQPSSAIIVGWSDASNRQPSNLPPSRSISYLLNPSRKEFSPRSYHLYVVQHPITGAECGSLSRIPLAPPLFVQLIVRDASGKVIPADDDLPFLVTAISLHKADSYDAGNLSSNNQLHGTTVAGPSNLRDMQNNCGVYFIFPDVGIRRCGQWKLHISLLRLALLGVQSLLVNGDAGQRIASIWTDFFEIKPQQTYVAPKITPLTRHFIRQGVQMFISSSVVPDMSYYQQQGPPQQGYYPPPNGQGGYYPQPPPAAYQQSGYYQAQPPPQTVIVNRGKMTTAVLVWQEPAYAAAPKKRCAVFYDDDTNKCELVQE
ncbi:hypothetical protein Clacol_005477 [Clathrus columnatus]|uniref:Velvet domain-containing protein n=1 Tax=Clathrus columnatus TaxID=1419009 RepID=A0AAV5AH36_9AGAM|nr:hypothetical protein Clacol_005477 [Clathrus columnatus]